MHLEQLDEILDDLLLVQEEMQLFEAHQELVEVNLVQYDFLDQIIVLLSHVLFKITRYLVQHCLKIFRLLEQVVVVDLLCEVHSDSHEVKEGE